VQKQCDATRADTDRTSSQLKEAQKSRSSVQQQLQQASEQLSASQQAQEEVSETCKAGLMEDLSAWLHVSVCLPACKMSYLLLFPLLHVQACANKLVMPGQQPALVACVLLKLPLLMNTEQYRLVISS